MGNPVNIKEEITRAIGAHGLWKGRLLSAIKEGSSEFSVDNVRTDKFCIFGQWLYSLPADVRSLTHWQAVRQLHGEFHLEAAKILALALRGDKAQAQAALADDSSYVDISSRLTRAMMVWRNAS